MSNPSRNNAMPETPVFSGPQGYASTKLEVKDSPHYVPPQEKSYAVTRKGYSPGTFTIQKMKDPGAQERPVIQGAAKPFDGIRDTRKERERLEEENLRLQVSLEAEKAQKGFLSRIPEHLVDWKERSVEAEKLKKTNIADETKERLTETEEDLEEKLEEFYNDPSENHYYDFLAALHAFTNKVIEADKEDRALPPKKTELEKTMELQKEILSLSFEVDAETEEAKALEEQISDGTKLSEFKNDVERIKILFSTLRRNPSADIKKQFDEAFEEYRNKNKKAIEEFIQKHPKPTAPAAPATPPASAPAPAVATAAKTSAPIPPEQFEKLKMDEGWPEDIVFHKEGDDKNKGGWFVNDKRGEHFLHNQDRWETENKNFSRLFQEYRNLVLDLASEDVQKIKGLIETKNRLVEAVKKFNINAVTSERKRFEAALSRWKKYFFLEKTLTGFEKLTRREEATKELFEHDFEKRDLEAARARVEPLYNSVKRAASSGIAQEEEAKKLKTLIEEYRKVLEKYEAKNKALWRTVLRPLKVTAANKDQDIKVIGKREMTLEEYGKVAARKQEAENMIVITDAVLNDWPELAHTYPLGSSVGKKEFGEATSFFMYDRMFKKNAQAFIGTYTAPEIDKRTHKIRYVTNRRFQMGTPEEKDVIRAVLEHHGLHVEDETWEERKISGEKLGKEARETKPSYKETFRPLYEQRKTAFGIPHVSKESDVMKRTDDVGFTRPMAEHAPQGKESKGGYTIPPQEESAAELDAIRKTQEAKNAALEAKHGWEGAMEKASSLLMRRIGAVTQKYGDSNPTARRMVLATILGAVAMTSILNAPYQEEETVPQKTEQSIEKGWRDYVGPEAKELQKDLDARKSVREIIAKYATKTVNKDKPASIDNVLQMDGLKVLKTANVYNLDDEQQAELCDFIHALQNISQAVSAPDTAKATLASSSLSSQTARYTFSSPPNDLEMPPHMKIEDYLRKIMKKVEEAGK